MRLERDSYVVRVERGRLAELVRDEAHGPVDATVETDIATLLSVQSGEESLEAAAQAGRLMLTGDAVAVQRLLAATVPA